MDSGKRFLNSLSARLLLLTAIFVMLAEVLIYLPSVARFRESYFETRLESAYLATRAVLAAPDEMVTKDLADDLLRAVGARAIVMSRADRKALILAYDMPPDPDAIYDMMQMRPVRMIAETLHTMLGGGDRFIRVIGAPPSRPDSVIDMVVHEAPLRAALREFSWRILGLSLVISLFTATLVFVALRWLMVSPMRRLTASMVAFRAAPEDASRVITPSRRGDEIGVAERELASMQQDLRAALTQKTRLAALGLAVSKIGHDLRNILATGQLISDRLAQSADPEVGRALPRLAASLDRAIALCETTLKYGRADEPAPRPASFALQPVLDDAAFAAGLGEGSLVLRSQMSDGLCLMADRDQIYRVMLNLLRNAGQSGANEVRVDAIAAGGRAVIEVADNGPGLSEAAREHLFEPFRGRSREGGSGLGLAIARELARANGGDLSLVRSGPLGTTFRIDLPVAG